MAEGTTMVLEVRNLGCEKCHKNIKKLLCGCREIRDQVYNEKKNTVIIKVVCSNPETIKQKLLRDGKNLIESIKIRPLEKAPEKPPAQPPSKPQAQPPSKPPAQPPSKPPAQDPAPPQVPVTGFPPMFYPRWVWCKQCFEGQWGGPCHCHHGSYWIPYQQPPSSYDGYLKLTPSYDGWPSGCRCDRSHGCRCEYYTENYPPCTLM